MALNGMYGDPDGFVDENGKMYDRFGKEEVREDHDIGWLDGDSMAENAKAPVYLINNILEADSHGTLLGASGSFKSFMAIAMAVSICTGEPFFGNEVFVTGKVLYVCGEGLGALGRRIKANILGRGLSVKNLIVVNTPIAIDVKMDMARLKNMVAHHRPALVIFDTFSSLTGDTNENDNSEVAQCLNLVRQTCRDGTASSMVVHHHGKDEAKGARGAYAFKANVDFEMLMTRQPDTLLAVFSCIKMKDGELFKDIGVQAEVVKLGLVRQDGDEATSLRVSGSGYVPDMKKKAGLSIQDLDILEALHVAIERHGVSPTPEIKDMFGGFSGYQAAHKKIVRFDHWRQLAYKTIVADDFLDMDDPSERKRIANNRRKTFNRTIEKLIKLKKIVTYHDYVWIY